jgi:hypothetical protein
MSNFCAFAVSVVHLGTLSNVRFFSHFSKILTIFALFGMGILLVVGAEAPDCPRTGTDESAPTPNAHVSTQLKRAPMKGGEGGVAHFKTANFAEWT